MSCVVAAFAPLVDGMHGGEGEEEARLVVVGQRKGGG
jgi:hypothetical protein